MIRICCSIHTKLMANNFLPLYLLSIFTLLCIYLDRHQLANLNGLQTQNDGLSQAISNTTSLLKTFTSRAEGEHFQTDDPSSYISTITEVIHQLPEGKSNTTSNVYEILSQMDCLPTSEACSRCLREPKRGGELSPLCFILPLLL